jgi:hypothetical protein
VLKFLLTVNFDQELRQFPQSLQGDHLAVHIGARAAIRADDPPHHELAVEIDRLVFQPMHRAGRQGRKAGRDLGALCALPRNITRPAAPRDEQQRIDHDGFARAGLAREGGQTAAEFELGLIDENQVS